MMTGVMGVSLCPVSIRPSSLLKFAVLPEPVDPFLNALLQYIHRRQGVGRHVGDGEALLKRFPAGQLADVIDEVALPASLPPR